MATESNKRERSDDEDEMTEPQTKIIKTEPEERDETEGSGKEKDDDGVVKTEDAEDGLVEDEQQDYKEGQPPIKRESTNGTAEKEPLPQNDGVIKELADYGAPEEMVSSEESKTGDPQGEKVDGAPKPAAEKKATSSKNQDRNPNLPQNSSRLPPGVPPLGLHTISRGNLNDADAIVEERAEVSAQYVGRVIGKGGEMIRDLQARSGCRMDVDQNVPAGNPRIITYRGSRKTVDMAKQMVAMLCTPQGNEAKLPLGEATRKQLVVPASSVGKIIGRGGEMIRELQSRSQAKIQVDHTFPQADTRSVTVTGTPQAVKKAEEMVMFLVANPLMDAMAAIQMLVDDKIHRGGTWGSGPPYPNMPNQGQNMTPSGTGGSGGLGGQGYDSQPYGPPHSGYGAPSYPPQHQPQPHHHQHGGHHYGQASSSSSSYYGNSSNGAEVEIFPAAKMYMGRIIGQKGVTINDLQKRSGCDIQINQNVPPGQDCEITIKGSRSGIESVKQMLREIIEMGPNHPYAGGGGQYQGGGGHGGGGGGGHGGFQHQHGGYAQPSSQPVYGYQQQQQQQQQQQPLSMYGQMPPQQQFGHPQQHYAPSQQQQQQSQQPYGMHYQQQSAPQSYNPLPSYGGPPPVMVAGGWKTATAADGQMYYYNEKTGETQWDKPAGMP